MKAIEALVLIAIVTLVAIAGAQTSGAHMRITPPFDALILFEPPAKPAAPSH